jgi:hypothetical protein
MITRRKFNGTPKRDSKETHDKTYNIKIESPSDAAGG